MAGYLLKKTSGGNTYSLSCFSVYGLGVKVKYEDFDKQRERSSFRLLHTQIKSFLFIYLFILISLKLFAAMGKASASSSSRTKSETNRSSKTHRTTTTTTTTTTSTSTCIVWFELINDDVLQKILEKLPALSFASAACVSKTWNQLCNHILSRPRISSALSLNPSPHVILPIYPSLSLSHTSSHTN